MKYLILAQYVKTKKKLWWCSTTLDLWKKGSTQFISGTTTAVLIVDIVPITDEQYELYKDL